MCRSISDVPGVSHRLLGAWQWYAKLEPWSPSQTDSGVTVQPSNSMGSDEGIAHKKRSSFLGRPLKELEELW